MPEISVIVPVHNGQAYIRTCLNSLLRRQALDDLEVIVVDDASNDHTAEIVSGYAEDDPRVRLISLEVNQGPGLARNVGLEHASGRFVMFLDGDDFYARDLLPLLHGRAEATMADIVMFDFTRLYWSGRRRRNPNAAMFLDFASDPPDSGVVTFQQFPRLTENFNSACTQLYRRAFLEAEALRFRPGFYEDLTWYFETLLLAQRITLVNKVGLHYRQRRHGSVLRSSDERHMALFDQYETLFDLLDEHSSTEWFRPLLYEKMMRHYVFVDRRREVRIPRALRRRYFEQMSDHAQRFRPPGVRIEGLRLRLRLVRGHRYFAYRLVRDAVRRWASFRKAGVKKSMRWRGQLGRWAKLRWYRLQRLRPLDPNLAAFEAYWGRSPAGNPLAIQQQLATERPDMRCVWLVRPSVSDPPPPGSVFVRKGSWGYYRTLARATYLVNNVNFPNDFVKRSGSTFLQTQHGTPLKRMGLDLMKYPASSGKVRFGELLRRVDNWDYLLSSNAHSSEIWQRAYPSRYEVLEIGYPRNDIFFGHRPEDVARIRADLGLDPTRTVVLYAPTFRDYTKGYASLLNWQTVHDEVGDDFVFLSRAHYKFRSARLGSLAESGFLVDATLHPSVEELCLAADVLITDYSSLMFDFAHLSRPIVIYAKDWDAYRQTRGTYFNVVANPPGAVARTQARLIEIMKTRRFDDIDQWHRLEAFRSKFCQFDDGNASERAVQALLGRGREGRD